MRASAPLTVVENGAAPPPAGFGDAPPAGNVAAAVTPPASRFTAAAGRTARASSPLRPVEIAGGGLAGLSLGLALRRAGVPVTIHEAGDYPRQRVCGEFITGLDWETTSRLGLEPLLTDAEPHRDVAWFLRARLIFRQRLPSTAWAIGRDVLDARLADEFVAAGGHLHTRTRVNPDASRAGFINATGRRRVDSPWLGLKLHVRGLALDRGLELHLGRNAYIGLCRLRSGEVNVCGLFHRRPLAHGNRQQLLLDYLEASGLHVLAQRLGASEPVPDSEAAVAGFGFGSHRAAEEEIALGDAQGMLPPFLGNGMASAFQSASLAFEPVVQWSRGHADWAAACGRIQRRLHRHFFLRNAIGAALHPLLLSPGRQGWLGALAQARCLPTRLLYRCLH